MVSCFKSAFLGIYKPSKRIYPVCILHLASSSSNFVDMMKKDIYLKPQEVCESIGKDYPTFNLKVAVQMADYLSRHLHRFDIISATNILLYMGRVKHPNDPYPISNHHFLDAVNRYFSELLHKCTTIESRPKKWGKDYGFYISRFFLFYGVAEIYNQSILDKITEIFLGPDDQEIHHHLFITRLAGMCAKIRYYDPVLMDHIIHVSLNKLESFNAKELSNLLKTMVVLNHEHQHFLLKVIEVVLELQDIKETCILYWRIINSCIFMNYYHHGVLKKFLSNEMMEESLFHGMFHGQILLKLLIALSIEKPDLGYGLVSNNTKPECFPYYFYTISNKHVHCALVRVLKMSRGATATKFGVNFSKSLKKSLGMGFFMSEPISLSGYMLDFEVLLGANLKPIKIPQRWFRRPISDILGMFGIWDDSKCETNRLVPESALPLSQTKNRGRMNNKIPSSHSVKKDALLVNLASDWGQYIMPTGIARRVMFELNGPRHYAVNVPQHSIGKDVIKRRQLQALGWDVIQVPYFKWSQLETEDDQAKYIAEQLRKT